MMINALKSNTLYEMSEYFFSFSSHPFITYPQYHDIVEA